MYLFHLSYSDPQAESPRAWSSFNSGVCSPPGGTVALQKQFKLLLHSGEITDFDLLLRHLISAQKHCRGS